MPLLVIVRLMNLEVLSIYNCDGISTQGPESGTWFGYRILDEGVYMLVVDTYSAVERFFFKTNLILVLTDLSCTK